MSQPAGKSIKPPTPTTRPTAPKAAETSLYMIGTSHQLARFSLSTDMFLIDRHHENIYSDNGTMQYQGPSRSYGWEAKASWQIPEHFSWNASLTQVTNAFYLGTAPREPGVSSRTVGLLIFVVPSK